MSQAEDIDRIVAALRKVPEKKLLLIQLVNSIPIKNGEFDYLEVQNKKLAINLAIQETKVYGAHTMQAVEALMALKPKAEV
jgi:hypothetical protein